MNQKIKELLTNSFLFTLANLGSKILVFLMVPFYTYILTPAEYGVAGIVQTTTTLLLPLVTAKIQDAVLRFCFVKGIDTRQVFSIGLKVSMIGVFIAVMLTFIFGRLPLFDEVGWYVVFVPLTVFSTSISQMMSFFSRGIGNVRGSAISGVVNTFVVVILNLWFLLQLEIGVTGYLLSYFIADLVSIFYLTCSSKLFKFAIAYTDINLCREMLTFSLPLVPTSLSWWFLSSFNNFYILSVLGTSMVGIYTASIRVPSILTVLSDIFSQAWLLSALKNYGSEEGNSFIRAIHRKFFAMLCFMTGGVILLTYPIANILLSGEFINSWFIIPYLFVSVFWGALVGFYGSIFSAENKTIIQLVSTVAGAFVSVIIIILFLKQNGLEVVTMATMVGYLVVWIIRKQALKHYIDIGMSTMYCFFNGSLLIIIAFFVSRSCYLIAIASYLLLLIINKAELMRILRFFRTEIVAYINKKK